MAGRTSTEEDADAKHPQAAMKTMAIRLTDEVSAQLTLVAQLEATSVAELIRQAIDQLLADKRGQGDLAAKAEAALAEIDQEAKARREAIQAMLQPAAEPTGSPSATGRSRRRGSGSGTQG